MSVVLFLLFLVLVISFVWTFYSKSLNRNTVGLHRSPTNERRRRKEIIIPPVATVFSDLLVATDKVCNDHDIMFVNDEDVLGKSSNI